MNRIFHHKITPVAKCAVASFTLFSLWCFWHLQAFSGFVTAVLVVLMVERVLHTTYTFMQDDTGNEVLCIERGRLSRQRIIRIADIVQITPLQTAFGASQYLLVKYGPNRLISLQPDDTKAFLAELKTRQ
jgi:hypothetical protein